MSSQALFTQFMHPISLLEPQLLQFLLQDKQTIRAGSRDFNAEPAAEKMIEKFEVVLRNRFGVLFQHALDVLVVGIAFAVLQAHYDLGQLREVPIRDQQLGFIWRANSQQPNHQHACLRVILVNWEEERALVAARNLLLYFGDGGACHDAVVFEGSAVDECLR